MLDTLKYKLSTSMALFMLVVSGCGSQAVQNNDSIATSVAQTVQAQNSLTALANTPIPPTATTAAELIASPATIATPTSAPVGAAPGCTVSASLIAETPPDDAILKPGEFFWKTWTLKNTGSCTWDSSYQLIYWSGDLMDGLTAYPIPEIVTPDAQKDISIYLKAPATEGTFAGYWKLQAPWGESFGVGQYGEPFYVQVVVSNARHPSYGITGVDFSVVRDPESGCPANVYYTLNAAVTTSGPLEVTYHWNASGSLFTTPAVVTFNSAGTKIISYTISVNKNSSKPTDYWIEFTISEPTGWNFKKVYLNHKCE